MLPVVYTNGLCNYGHVTTGFLSMGSSVFSVEPSNQKFNKISESFSGYQNIYDLKILAYIQTNFIPNSVSVKIHSN